MQPVRIGDAARQQERVVFLGPRLVERAVDRDLVTDLVVVHALDRAGVWRDDIGCVRAGLEQRASRFGELGLLEAVGGENGDAFPQKLLGHEKSPSDEGLCSPNSPLFAQFLEQFPRRQLGRAAVTPARNVSGTGDLMPIEWKFA